MIHSILLEAVFRAEFGFWHRTLIAGLWDVSDRHHSLHRDQIIFQGWLNRPFMMAVSLSNIPNIPKHSLDACTQGSLALPLSFSPLPEPQAWLQWLSLVQTVAQKCHFSNPQTWGRKITLGDTRRHTAMFAAQQWPAVVFVIRYIYRWVWKASTPRRCPG